jgi:hypothetical protein
VGDGVYECTGSERVVVCVNASASKLPAEYVFETKFLDEAHHLEQEGARMKALDAIPTDGKTVLMSATFHEQNGLDFILPMDRAIKDGYISDYIIHVSYFSEGCKMEALAQLLACHGDWLPAFVYFNSTARCIEFCGVS